MQIILLLYKDSLEQIENISVNLVTLTDRHMSHIENREELPSALLDFFKEI